MCWGVGGGEGKCVGKRVVSGMSVEGMLECEGRGGEEMWVEV